MKENDLRKWIEAGYKHYGKDPWFFIRELAQNSRDAGASIINVHASYIPGKEEILIFEDNGTGMSFEHAVQYLFRLYASSKTNDKNAAGMFGIGFWTVLKFTPTTLIIESNYREKRWGVIVDSELQTTRTPSDLDHPGTRITLIRTPQEPDEETFRAKILEALDKYCCFLRKNNRNADPLPIFFQGKNINRPMILPGPISLKFKEPTVEGVVGLGPKPEVRLYARGLPVWDGTTLDELFHTPPSENSQGPLEPDMSQGSAPVFLLNGNRLEVNLSRRRVIDNRDLQELIRTAQKALARMVSFAADAVSPRSASRRFTDQIRSSITAVSHSFIKMLLLLLVLIIPIEILVIKLIVNPSSPDSTDTLTAIRADQPYYSGATVSETRSSPAPGLFYSPPVDTWFKLYTAENWDNHSGFIQDIDQTHPLVPPTLDCNTDNFSVRLSIPADETGKLFLPYPVPRSSGSYVIRPDEVTVDGVPVPTVSYYQGGEIEVSLKGMNLPASQGPARELRYRCCLVRNPGELSPERFEKLTHVSGTLALPPKLENQLKNAAMPGTPLQTKIRAALLLTASLLTYDSSADTARKFRQSKFKADWFRKVMEVGAGDCDILNSAAALFLRKMEIPAHLAVGFIGKAGQITPGLHAWVEYYDNGWHILDATPPAAAPPNPFPDKKIDSAVQVRHYPHPSTGSPSSLLLIALLTTAALLLFFIIFLIRKKSKELHQPLTRSAANEIREGLASMILHDLLHPGAWGQGFGLRRFPLIPTLQGNFFSLYDALKLGKQQKIFSLDPNRHPSLSSYLSRAKIPILDAGNNAFAPVIKLLPGVIQLEKIISLLPTSFAFDDQETLPRKTLTEDEVPGPPGVQTLIDSVLRILNVLKIKIPPLVVAPGLVKMDFLDVDLSLLPPLEQWGIPNRFIAVNPNSVRVQKWAGLVAKNPRLAQFRFIYTLLRESSLVPSPSGAVLERVSQELTQGV